jgi:hypothetical protein
MNSTISRYLKIVTDPRGLPKTGSLLLATWRFYRARFPDLMRLSAILIVGVVFTLPGFLMSVVGVDKRGSLVTAQPADVWTHLSLTAIGVLVTIIASIFVSISLNASAYAEISGKRILGRAALFHGLKIFWPYVFTLILLKLALGIGLALLFIPGLVVFAYLAFAEQAVIIEEIRGLNPFRRSLALVVGRFWPVFWRLLACYVAFGIVALVGSALLVRLPLALAANLLAHNPLMLKVTLAPLMLIGGAVTALIAPLPIIFQVQLYDRLKKLAK